jgi:hypothetical protein
VRTWREGKGAEKEHMRERECKREGKRDDMRKRESKGMRRRESKGE